MLKIYLIIKQNLKLIWSEIFNFVSVIRNALTKFYNLIVDITIKSKFFYATQVFHMFTNFTKLKKIIVHRLGQFYRQSKLQLMKQPSSSCLNCFLTSNEFIIKGASSIAKQFIDLNSKISMKNLDVDSVLVIVSVEETIKMCTNLVYDKIGSWKILLYLQYTL